MRIGVLGAGKVGGSLARAWAASGHEVMLSARDLVRAQQATEGPEASLKHQGGMIWTGTAVEAASFADCLVLAVPSAQIGPLLRGTLGRGALATLPRLMGGKVLIDASNPLAGWSIPRVAGLSHSECVAAMVPDMQVVKAFNMMPAVRMAEGAAARVAEAAGRGARSAPVLSVFVAGDAEAAKSSVRDLVRDAGFAPIDLGRLAAGRAFEPGGPLFAVELTEEQARTRMARLGDATAVLPREFTRNAA